MITNVTGYALIENGKAMVIVGDNNKAKLHTFRPPIDIETIAVKELVATTSIQGSYIPYAGAIALVNEIGYTCTIQVDVPF